MDFSSIRAQRFGIITALIYASFLVYLPPAQSMPDAFKQELINGYVAAYGFIGCGILAGVLLYWRPRIGRVIAITLAVAILLMRIVAFSQNTTNRLYALYVLTLQQKPLMVIHNDIILPLFGILTVAYLVRSKSVAET